MAKRNTYEEKFWNNISEWVVYWRLNIHRFCEDYIGIKLHFFQKILMYLMDAPYSKKISYFVFFASRGLGKTFLCALYCVAKAILFPGIKIKCASASINQAKILFEKINEIIRTSPTLADEISSSNFQKDHARIILKNTSTIETIVSGDGARGQRAHILVLDESRLLVKGDIQQNLVPLLTGNRMTPWGTNPKYKKYLDFEHNTLLFLTSIGYKDEWSYKDFEDYVKRMADGEDGYCALALPYQFGVETNIISGDYIEKQLMEKQVDPKIFRMEMEVVPYGETDGALFKYEDLSKSRKLVNPMVPISDSEYIRYYTRDAKHHDIIKKSLFYTKKEKGEIRVLSYDIAIARGKKNDNSVFTLIRLFDNGDYYKKHIPFMEVMNGVNLDYQVLRLKQLFYDFECDYVVVDAGGGLGINAVDACGKKTHDPFRDKIYPGWKTYDNNQKWDERVSDPDAEAVMYCMQVTGAGASAIQEAMTHKSQREFDLGRVDILVSEDDAMDYLNEKYSYLKLRTSNVLLDNDIANSMIGPFSNISKFITEAINTKLIRLPSGKYTIEEKRSDRKDRVICVMYALHFIGILEKDLEWSKQKLDISAYGQTSAGTSQGVNNSPFASNLGKLSGFGWRK